MKLHRFYVGEMVENKKEIIIPDSSFFNQLKNVFRFHPGDSIIIFDNSGSEYVSEIVSLTKSETVLKIVSQENRLKDMPKKEVTLFVSLIKKDNTEWVLQKATELGVTAFVPVISERTEKKDINVERAQKIIVEASEQSGRVTLPVLHEVTDLKSALSTFDMPMIAFHGGGEVFTQEAVKNIPRIGVLIGPEGGWGENEIKLFKEKNISIYALGHNTLRAETASVAVSALLLL